MVKVMVIVGLKLFLKKKKKVSLLMDMSYCELLKSYIIKSARTFVQCVAMTKSVSNISLIYSVGEFMLLSII